MEVTQPTIENGNIKILMYKKKSAIFPTEISFVMYFSPPINKMATFNKPITNKIIVKK